MTLNMHWGKGIFLVLTIFVLVFVGILFYSATLDWSLVEDDYYPKELRHEELLNKKRNFYSLGEPLLVILKDSSVEVKFPSVFKGKPTGGHIQVYRPSDKNLDYLVPVQFDTTMIQKIPRSRFRHGNYVVKVEWYSQGIEYYKEQELFIP
jgi:hypothetical protein